MIHVQLVDGCYEAVLLSNLNYIQIDVAHEFVSKLGSMSCRVVSCHAKSWQVMPSCVHCVHPQSSYTYVCIYNLHLGLIKVSPLFVFPLKTTFFTIHLLSTRPDIYYILAKTLLIRFCDTGDTSCAIMGVILGMILKVSKRDPSKRGQLYT